MHLKQYILIITSLLLFACQKDSFTFDNGAEDNKPYVVGFWAGGGVSGNTRTTINDDGQSVSWEQGDKVALWASQNGSYTFTNEPFNLWFRTADNSQAFFASSNLKSEMPEGEYTYYACYPVPQSVTGTTATFTIPSTQNGKMSGGADIMVAQGTGPALRKLYTPAGKQEEGETSNKNPDYVLDQNRLSLDMCHLIHALRFYVPQAKWGFGGETIERIVFTMPQAVAGTFVADVSAENPALSNPSATSNSITLDLSKNMVASTSGENGVEYDYAVAAIVPPSTTYGANDKMVVKTYSQTKVATQEISLSGRGPGAQNENMRMAAGSVTPVGLDCSTTSERSKISFRIASNNLGEQPYKITLTSSDTSTQWKAGDDHVYEYYTGSESTTVAEGGGFDIYCDDDTSIWGKQITVTYESKSAIVSEVISSIPAISNGTTHNVYLNVPYLLYENFSSVSGFSSNDNYTKGSNAGWYEGNQDGISFLNGWSGGRIGAQAGTAIRLACRRETSANYPARVDSAPLTGLKDGATVTLSITFDYGMDRKEGGLGSNPELGQTCYLGYVKNNTDVISSGKNVAVYGIDGQEGEFPKNFYIKETGASYTNLPHKNYNYSLSGCDNTTRLTWLTTNDNKAGTTNGTFWLYIDNVRVKIVP